MTEIYGRSVNKSIKARGGEAEYIETQMVKDKRASSQNGDTTGKINSLPKTELADKWGAGTGDGKG